MYLLEYFLTGRQFPTFNSVFFEEITLSPIFNFCGQMIYEKSPSLYLIRAMCADLLGSYSILSTLQEYLKYFS